MTIEEWAKDFKSFVNELQMPRDDYKGIMEYIDDAIALLKEQEEREQRICKSICNFIRGACSTDTDDDKDFVCYEIQKCFTEGR